MYNGDFETKQADIETWKSEFPFSTCTMLLIELYTGLIFEELTSFHQQPCLYKQKLGFECRQSGPITFQN